MAYQMTITLTDAEYRALSVEAAKNDKPLESLLPEVLVQHIKPSAPIAHSLTSHQIQEYLYHEGIIEDIPIYAEFAGFRKNDPAEFQERLELAGQQAVDDFARMMQHWTEQAKIPGRLDV